MKFFLSIEYFSSLKRFKYFKSGTYTVEGTMFSNVYDGEISTIKTVRMVNIF